MRALRIALAATVAVMVTGCSGMSIRSDYNPQANFDSYSTYAWLPAPTTGDPRLDNAILEGRIKAAVDNALAEKGFRLADNADDATFWVGYHIGIEGRMDVTTVNSYYGYGWGPWYGGAYRDTQVRYYDQGTLLIDVIDAGAQELAWRGTAEAEVHNESSPERRQQRLNEAVTKILDRFPPR
jgi:hypothetical protein